MYTLVPQDRFEWRAMFHTYTSSFPYRLVFYFDMYYHYVSDLVFLHYDFFDLWPDHVIKSHAIGSLGSISSFPQNLVHI